jgi:hypothetical protein
MEGVGAKGAGGRAGGGSGRGLTPFRKGVRGYHPRENFRNLTTLMCILETEIFTFVLHVQLYTVKFNTAQERTSLKFTLECSQISRMCATFA